MAGSQLLSVSEGVIISDGAAVVSLSSSLSLLSHTYTH